MPLKLQIIVDGEDQVIAQLLLPTVTVRSPVKPIPDMCSAPPPVMLDTFTACTIDVFTKNRDPTGTTAEHRLSALVRAGRSVTRESIVRDKPRQTV